MNAAELQQVADSVVRRAEQQGYVVPTDIRTALLEAGLSGTYWKDVIALTRPTLRYRNGRYYHERAVSTATLTMQKHQRAILRAVRQLTRAYRSLTREQERREQLRHDFMLPVQVHLDSGKVLTLVSRDISASGIRLMGTHRLLGQKVKVVIAQPGALVSLPLPTGPRWAFVVRILWTCAVSDDLFENGGSFLEVQPIE